MDNAERSARFLGRIGIVWPGDPRVEVRLTPEGCRLHRVFDALFERHVAAEAVVYADEVVDKVRDRLLGMDAVLVWVNPIEDGRDRSKLDAMLREVAAAGVFVSAHPDVILKMGTKEVLYTTRELGWGSGTDIYRSMAELRERLSERLGSGEARVLKQYRGNGGSGVWKVQLTSASSVRPGPQSVVRVRHALRGSIEQEMTLDDFLSHCEPYFEGPGRIVDQPYQERLTEGMIRCYLVHEKVVGFGHQAINALYPAPHGAAPSAAPQPGPRLYHPPIKPEFQSLKRKLEDEWVPAMQRTLDIARASLPVIWDADFLYGEKDDTGADTYVLCEINVSSVFPFPEEALIPLAEAAAEAMLDAKTGRSVAARR
jgi:hypothetical protein